MSGDFAFDIEDLESMPKTKSKKTKAGGRRLPLRSEAKKLKPNETISIEDDPEQKSSSYPIMVAPLSQVLTSPTLKTILERAEQSWGVVMKDLDEAFKVMEKYKEGIGTAITLQGKLEKREKDWEALNIEIAKMRAAEKQEKIEMKSLYKANQSLSIKNQELVAKIKKLEGSQVSGKRVMMLSAQKSVIKTKIKMELEAEAAGHKVDAWNVDKWEEELLEMDDVVPVEEVVFNPKDVTAQVVKDLVDQHMEEANEQVDDNGKGDNGAEVADDGGINEEAILASNEGNDNLA